MDAPYTISSSRTVGRPPFSRRSLRFWSGSGVTAPALRRLIRGLSSTCKMRASLCKKTIPNHAFYNVDQALELMEKTINGQIALQCWGISCLMHSASWHIKSARCEPPSAKIDYQIRRSSMLRRQCRNPKLPQH